MDIKERPAKQRGARGGAGAGAGPGPGAGRGGAGMSTYPYASRPTQEILPGILTRILTACSNLAYQFYHVSVRSRNIDTGALARYEAERSRDVSIKI